MQFAGERALGALERPGGGDDARRALVDRRRGLRRAPAASCAEVHLAGVDGYAFTAGFLAWAAQQPVDGAGALGPVEAYGLERL